LNRGTTRHRDHGREDGDRRGGKAERLEEEDEREDIKLGYRSMTLT
jgi:hypothetical protein